MPLLYHTGALGDFVLALPFLRALGRRFPAASWTLVAHEEHSRLVSRLFPHERRGVPGLLEFAPLARGGGDREDEDSERALEALAKRHGGLFGFARGAHFLESVLRRRCPDLPSVLAEPFAHATGVGESIEGVLEDAISRVGLPCPRLASGDFALDPLELPELDRASLRADLQGLEGRAWIHIGASARARMPPADLLLAVAHGLEARGLGVVWIRGPVEAARGFRPPRGPILDAPEIVAFAHGVSRARLYIGADTGPTHLASALGVPTIALHGVPNPSWHPRGARALVLGGTGAGAVAVAVATGFPEAQAVLAAARDLESEAERPSRSGV